jgi:hypothetical protein
LPPSAAQKPARRGDGVLRIKPKHCGAGEHGRLALRLAVAPPYCRTP